jgi:hypothetical protein
MKNIMRRRIGVLAGNGKDDGRTRCQRPRLQTARGSCPLSGWPPHHSVDWDGCEAADLAVPDKMAASGPEPGLVGWDLKSGTGDWPGRLVSGDLCAGSPAHSIRYPHARRSHCRMWLIGPAHRSHQAVSLQPHHFGPQRCSAVRHGRALRPGEGRGGDEQALWLPERVGAGRGLQHVRRHSAPGNRAYGQPAGP